MLAQIDKDYLKQGFVKPLRRFLSYALFEGRPHTTKGQWFNPVVRAFLKSSTILPFARTEIKRPIFIAGLGRSGTTVLGTVMSLHNDIGFLNEPKLIWELVDPRFDTNDDYSVGCGRFQLGTGDLSPSSICRAKQLFSFYLYVTRSKVLLDKYPEHIFKINALLDIFSDAKVIFIARNGYDACNSIVQWSEKNGVTKADITEDWWGRNDAKWNYLWHQLVLENPCYSDLHCIDMALINSANRAAIEWIVTMDAGLEACQLHPNSVMKISYEVLTKRPRAVLSEVVAFCKLEEDEPMLSFAQTKLRPNERSFKLDLIPEIECYFERTMKKLGYLV